MSSQKASQNVLIFGTNKTFYIKTELLSLVSIKSYILQAGEMAQW